MTGKERVMAVLDGKIPDKVPHFEMGFQLCPEALGRAMPVETDEHGNQMDRQVFITEYLTVWDLIVKTYDWAAIPVNYKLLGNTGEMIGLAKEHFADQCAVFDFNGQGTFWMMDGDKMMDFAVRLYDDWNGLIEEAKRKRDNSIELARKQIESGADFIIINSDYAFNKGPFISPEMFSELVTPFLKEIVDAIHSMGKKAILHSDGDLRLILDQLVSTGLDGYQSIDPQGNMDIAKVRAEYPNLLLMGNVKTSLLQEVDDKAIRESVRYAMNSAKKGGRFIFSTSNVVFKGMPLESYHIMLDEYEKHAWYSKGK